MSVNGLTFTSTGTSSATQVAAAFANLSSGMTAASAKAANTVSAALGTFSGTFTAGFSTGSNASGTSVTATATLDNRGNVDSIVPTSRVPTVVTTPGSGTVTENSALTFSSLSAGQSITVNGLKFTAMGNLTATQVASAYSSLSSGMTAEQAATANAASSAIGSYSGNFTAGFTTGTITGATVTATSTTANSDVTNIVVSSDTSFPTAVTTNGLNVAASTAYGTVSLKSESSFTIEPGTNYNNTSYPNFTTLGFVAGPVIMQNVGRVSFQVGSDNTQTLSIDLGDFGKGGNITGVITSDAAKTAIDTPAGAQNVMNLVNTALNAVAAERSNMGSVINRLQEISDNLTTVQTNEMSSRSQIEDTDFAAASAQLSRTQIMTQAATAVLAQANTDMQTVLKLLQ
jgi:flagellin